MAMNKTILIYAWSTAGLQDQDVACVLVDSVSY